MKIIKRLKNTFLGLTVFYVLLSVIGQVYLASSGDGTAGSVSQAENSGKQLQKASLVRVVDGDTIIVKISGEDVRVRLIGIDTPESVNPDESKNSESGKLASKYTKSILKKGQTLYLEKDTSNKDKYDRLLRYVWLKKPASTVTEKEISTKMLNGILVKKGYAYAKTYYPNIKYSEIFKKLEQEAKNNEIGILWEKAS